MIENTVILIKPDAVEGKYVGRIIDRLEANGITFDDIRFVRATKRLIDAHYAHMLESEHYPRILAWMTRSPLVAMLARGEDVIAHARALIGPTDPLKAPRGTIRGDFASDIGANRIHASANYTDFVREYEIWFDIPRAGEAKISQGNAQLQS
jgi:nucleoside-diphosphate kinase